MPKSSEPKKTEAKQEDVVLVHGRTEDGEGHVVLRKRGDTLALGEVRPMREGRPITGELVKLKPRDDHPNLADVEVVHAVPESRGGPARVSTPAYRAGWAQVFGEKKPSQAKLLN